MATYLVTGGAGFIGSHLVDALVNQNHKVVVLDDLSTGKRVNVNPKARLVVGDIRDVEVVRACMKGTSGCFHLAAVASVQQSVTQWRYTHEVNSTGTVNILDAAAKVNTQPIPVVYASSAAIYGDNSNVPLTEAEVPSPLSAYGADKLSCEHHAKVAGLLHQVPTKGFRFFNVYGPRQDPSSPYSGVISIFTSRISKQLPVTIFGDGQQTRDFVYVDDIVKHLLAGMNSADTSAEVLNVCSGQPTTIEQLALIIYNILRLKPNIIFEPSRPGDIQVSLGSPENAIRSLGIKTEIAVQDGLRKTTESDLDDNEKLAS